ncbi:hybrid sensor histidine kinase/response regulator transcription factor [Bacteroides intestinalis]|jgi:signal transduction histidine kinase/ligand-binding sensor domain-containing protein/DNA-binding response OmpR family regulator|uniref:histidine kinase n=1 Tax=Bacteroides intestinalis TaxID=329854 RepID=A0A414L6W7_9BACE|nr:two-component regulator propeller domain-containing protein [Bacteroides intestinalis]RHE90344.1 response regulator [Bacteroides intestinalis]
MKTAPNKAPLIVLLFCLVVLPLAAQTGKFYSTNNELSSSLINQIFQDKRGFIWIATEYGLNRFDGLRFSNYKHMSGDSTSIKNNYVRTLYEDSRQNLLVGCIDGLMKYDSETDTFREIPMIRAGKQVFPHVTQMQKLHNGEIWAVTTGQGIFRLDEEKQQAVSIDAIMKQVNYNFQSNLYEDSDYNIWIGTEGHGLICYLPATQEVRIFRYPAINDNYVSAIGEDKYGNLFIGTQKHGLSRYDREQNRFVPVPYTGSEELSIYCLTLVDDHLLIGTDGQGLKTYNRMTGKIEDYSINSAPLDFSEGKIHAILEDRDKNLWVGLFQKGIVLIPKQENPFEYYGNKSIYYNPIGQGCVMSIYQDSNHHLWVAADNEGVFELDAEGRRLRHYQPGNNPRSMANTIMCMYEDTNGDFWLGSYTRGLAKLNRRTGECEYPLPVDNEKIFSIAEDRHKNLYIATFGSGFYQYNLVTKELKHYESSKDETGDLTRNELANDWVNYIFCDSEGMIWLGHYKGISCFNPANESFINYRKVNTLVEDRVGYVVQEDHAGNIWAGTTDGLYCFNKKTDELTCFTVADGLPNNVICGICEDEEHNMWISTYMGICKYDAKTGRYINYYAGDGLQGNEFTHGAFYKDEAGKVYFGGINGITYFQPSSIGSVLKDTKVWITDFSIFNQPVRKNTRSGRHTVIYTSVPDANMFQLAHYDNTFSIVFSTLQYNNPEQISYQYKIEELSNQWLSTEPGVNRVTYNNLLPGKYTFHVRALSHGNLSEIRTVKILITPPWYEMWWAYCIYAFLFGLLVLGIVNYILSRMRHRREIMKREHAEQLNEAKLQFFINISHEIRTPMTLIINPLEKLLAEKKGGEVQKTYLMIYRNAQRILRLINQLMDIRKLDKGQMFMKFRETDMVGFIDDVMLTFDYMARKKKIRFSFEHVMPQLKVWVDMNNFDKILMNIFSNAFKYTPEQGEITVTLSTGRDSTRRDPLKEYFEITVTDNGIGLDREKIERIFERFYQIDNDVTKSNFGTGIGLHLSRSLVELHHGIILAENREDAPGSRFIIRIPLGSAHLRTDELEDVEAIITPHTVLVKPEKTDLEGAFEEEEDEESKKAGKSKNRMRILIVEDEEEILSYLKEELEGDYRIMTRKNGREAYDTILADTPDLVISDIMMPEMDGLSLCRKIKQNTNVNHVPVILLTAKSKPEDTMEGMATGADAYMVKPFNTELLKSTIANLIANRKLLKSKFSGAQQQEDKVQKLSMKSADEILMSKIMKVINENLSNPDLNVEMLAANVGLSRVHVHRKLKELTNLSARDFIKNIRLQQAAALLKEKKLTVSEVAYATGYTNLSHFSSSFKEVHGMSPKEYMLAHQG